MSLVPPPGDVPVTGACRVRELGEWEALDAYRAEIAAASIDELTGHGSAAYYLRQAALEAVIEQRMRIRCSISIHHALLAGVPVREIAHVAGVSCEEAAERWRGWADGQRRLQQRFPGLGMSRGEYGRAAAGIENVGPAGGSGRFTQCTCPGMDGQIGSPHP
jgi:hypothetical protein